jgi:hypothetical protein
VDNRKFIIGHARESGLTRHFPLILVRFLSFVCPRFSQHHADNFHAPIEIFHPAWERFLQAGRLAGRKIFTRHA